MYKQVLKDLWYTQVPPDLQVQQKRDAVIQYIEELIQYVPSTSDILRIDETKSEAPTTPRLAATFTLRR